MWSIMRNAWFRGVGEGIRLKALLSCAAILFLVAIPASTVACSTVACLGRGVELRRNFTVRVTHEGKCFRQLDLAPFDRFIWPHPLVNPLSAPGRSEALRSPKGDAFRA